MSEQPNPGEARGPAAMAFGVYYPKGYLVAVIEDEARATAAASDLREGGFADVGTWSGEEVLINDEKLMRQRSFLQRLESLIASDEKEAVEEYRESARQGRYFVTVLAPSPEEMTSAASILHRHEAHKLHHYGERVMTDLSSHPNR
jgi:hypothetical protein